MDATVYILLIVVVVVILCCTCVSKGPCDKETQSSHPVAVENQHPVVVRPIPYPQRRQTIKTQIRRCSFTRLNNEQNQSDSPVDDTITLYPKVSVNDFREKAKNHHEERLWCFDMASAAYNCGDGAGAKFYSNEGHKHTRLMEEANEDALNLLIEQCDPALQQTNTLDLHGFFVNEGIDYLDEVIEEREEAFTRGREYLTVITGKGLHSDGRIKLRPALIEYLNDGRYQYTEETRGVFKFKLHPRNIQNVINIKPKNEHSHPVARKVKQRYMEKKKASTSVKNRFDVLQDMDSS